jgi:hypothetical protein
MSNKLDKFIQREVEAGSFAPSELDWYNMAKMLELQNKKKRPIGIWIWLSSTLLLSLVATGVYQFNKKESNAISAHQVAQTKIAQQSTVTNTNTEEAVSASKNTSTHSEAPTINKQVDINEKNINNEQAIKNTKIETNNTKEIFTNNTIAEASSSKVSDLNINKENRIASNNEAPKSLKNNNPIANFAKPAPIKQKTIQQAVKETKPQAEVIAKLNTNKEQVKITTPKAPVKRKKSIPTQAAIQSQMDKDIVAQLNNKASRKEESPKQHIAHSMAEYKALVQQYGVNNITKLFPPSETNPRYNPDAVFQANTKAPAPIVEASNNTPTASIEPPNDLFNNDEVVKNKFYFLGAVSANKQFAPSTGYGYTPCVGFGLSKRLSDKWSLGSQVLYLRFDGVNSYKAQAINKYSFGRKQDSFRVNYNSFSQIAIPLRMEYHFAKVISLQAGVQPTYIVEVHSKVQNGSAVATKENGYRTGFNKLDIMATAGLGINFAPRFGLDLMYARGFTDVTQNNYFNNTNIDNQQRINIGFKYTFKNK